MRYLCIDLGEKRTGIAMGDDETGLISPLDVVVSPRGDALMQSLLRIIDQQQPGAIVLGLPLNMDGSEGPAAKAVREFGDQVSSQAKLPIHYQDERLSSYAADQRMAQTGRTHKQKKELRDALAAAEILRDFFDGRDNASEILRLHRCPLCGYDLRGLPVEAKCPECGFQYDARMSTLVGRATSKFRLRSTIMVILAYIAIFAFVTGIYAAAFSAIAGLIIIMILVPIVRGRTGQKEWLLFTAEGVSSRHAEGKFSIIPWRDFKRVAFHQSFFSLRGVRKGLQTWQIRLYREPLFHVVNPNSRWAFGRYRKTSRDLTFEFHATKEDASRVVAELRQRFAAGWAVN